MKDDTDLLNVAHKETKEETGLVAQKIKHLFDFFLSPGGLSEKKYFFLAIVDSNNALGFHGCDHEKKYIEVVTTSKRNAIAMLQKNEFTKADIIIAMQWFSLNEDKIF